MLSLADTLVVMLLWTNPSASVQLVDSTFFSCSGGLPLTTLDTIYVYGANVAGGGFNRLLAHPALGNEGKPDSVGLKLPGWAGGNFYVLAHNPGGLSCQSPTVYKGTTTGVNTDPSHPNPVNEEEVYWYNVQGRRVPGNKINEPDPPYATGVYFRRIGKSGKAKKFVLFK